MWQEKTQSEQNMEGLRKETSLSSIVCIMERKKGTQSEIFNNSLMKKAGGGDITVLQLHLKVIFVKMSTCCEDSHSDFQSF